MEYLEGNGTKDFCLYWTLGEKIPRSSQLTNFIFFSTMLIFILLTLFDRFWWIPDLEILGIPPQGEGPPL